MSSSVATMDRLGPDELDRTQRRERLRSLGSRIGTGVALFALYLFLYAPLLIIVLFSFNADKVQTLPFAGFSTRWYESLFNNDNLIDAAIFSFQISGVAVLVGLVFGTGFALMVDRLLGARSKGIVQALLAVPVVLPGVVLGISLLVVFREVGINPGYWAIVIGHATFVTPIVMFVVLTRLRTMDPVLEHASMDLGGGWWQTFLYVTLPQIRVALLAAALLAFTVSFDELLVTFFLAGVDITLPVYVWNQLRFGFTPEINAVFTLIGGFSIIAILVGTGLLSGTLRKRDGENGRGAAVGDA
ncbi:MAG: ABC transporter permease [Acidobacteria bacterium]|nr:MAG: ABC transporter permease [Acidobacteriota bacterium]